MKKSLLIIGFAFTTCLTNAQTVSTIGQTIGVPSGIAVGSNGDIYVAERSPGAKITKFNSTTFASSTFSISGFVDPLKIAFGPGGKLFVADFNTGKIVSIPATGGVASDYVTGASQPAGFTFDGDTLYFIEYTSQKIFKALPGGGAVGSVNVVQISDSALWMSPGGRGTGLTLLPNGNLYVTAALNYMHYEVSKVTGSIIEEIYVETALESAHTVFDATLLSDDKIYLPIYSQNKLWTRAMTSFGCEDYMGNGSSASIDGSDTIAAFHGPYFIAHDASENLYVTESDSKNIRKITNAIVGINDIVNTSFKVHPNPTANYINIQLEVVTNLSILSSEGKIIATLSGSSNYHFDASTLENGVYFIQAENGGVQKFIKN